MGIIHVTQLRRSHADDYVDWRNARAGRILSAHSLNMEINAMKAALQRAKDLDTASVPDERVWRTAEVKAVPGVNRKVVMPLDMGQQMRLLEVLQTRHPWARDITLFLLLTGMRISELDGMSRGDVHLAEMVIDLHGRSVGGGSASGKTEHAPRILPIVPALVPLLQGESLWIRSSQPVGDRLRTVLKRMRDEIGFPVSPHQLRHSYATNHLQSEPRDLPVVSYRLGHSSIQVTKDIYAKWLRSEMAVGIELFTRAYKEHLARLEGRHAVNQISGVG
jgi:integrase